MKSPRWHIIALWLLSTLLILCGHRNWPAQRVWIALCESIPRIAAGEAWQVPLGRFPEIVSWLQWPLPLYALAAAFILVRTGPGHPNTWHSLLGLVGLSLMNAPQYLIPATCISLLSFQGDRPDRWRPFFILGFAVLTTVEYGVVALLTATALFTGSPRTIQRYPRFLRVLVLLAIMGTSVFFVPGFGQTLGRPLIALGINPPEHLMASLRTLSGLRENWLAWACLAPTILFSGLKLSQQPASRCQIVTWSLLLILGIACTRYSFLSAIGIVRLSQGPHLTEPPGKRFGPVLGLSMISAMVYLALITTEALPRSERLSPGERFHLEQWDTQGIVVLTNLERSQEWQTPSTFERFPLMASDRWELCGDRLSGYEAFCRDLCEGREHRYLRRDNSWGGYKLWTREQSAAFLAVEATEIDSVRRISVSPDWRIVGIDGEQVLFGNSAMTSNRALIRKTSEDLLAWEWKGTFPSDESSIIVGRESSRPTLAGVICSARFPYAALKLLGDLQGAQAEAVRASCLVELSHRVAAHASQLSLLDQYRAQVLVARVLRSGADTETVTRLTRGLKALDARISAATDSTSPEQQIRTALLSGQTETARDSLNAMPAPLRGFFAVLVDSPDLLPLELFNQLRSATQQLPSEIPTQTLAEAWFYVGCAALEANQTSEAVEAFRNSERIGPESSLYQIRNLYLRQTSR